MPDGFALHTGVPQLVGTGRGPVPGGMGGALVIHFEECDDTVHRGLCCTVGRGPIWIDGPAHGRRGVKKYKPALFGRLMFLPEA